MWKSVEDPPSTNRDVVVSDGEGWYVIAFYDEGGKAWYISDNMFYKLKKNGFDNIKLWCEIPKLNE